MKRFLSLTIVLYFFGVFGWNMESNPKDMYPNKINKGHHWITEKALKLLDERGILEKKFKKESYKEKIHFGLSFADDPWLGRVENPKKCYEGVLQELIGRTYDKETCNFERYRTEVSFRGECGTSKPNMHLDLNWYFAVAGGMNKHSAGDNMFHFDNGGYAPVVKVHPQGLPVNTIPDTYRGSRVSVVDYGSILYNLSLKFWNSNPYLPSFADMRLETDTGKIFIDAAADSNNVRAYLPSTYLGGNPFICTNDIVPEDLNLCLYGTPTWPLWVPETYDETKISEFHDDLMLETHPKSDAASLVYLGWALHMYQDIAMPYHVAGWTGDRGITSHTDIEGYADDLIKMNLMTKDYDDFESELNQLFGTIENHMKLNEMCSQFGLKQGGNSINIRMLYQELADLSYSKRGALESFDLNDAFLLAFNQSTGEYKETDIEAPVVAMMLGIFDEDDADDAIKERYGNNFSLALEPSITKYNQDSVYYSDNENLVRGIYLKNLNDTLRILFKEAVLGTMKFIACHNIMDTDGDGVSDREDNCPNYSNSDQADMNSDGTGDICGDIDNDDIQDAFDLCPYVESGSYCNNCQENPGPDCCLQADWNDDGIGDECDLDGDGIDDRDDEKVFYTKGYWTKWADPKSITNQNESGSGNFHWWTWTEEIGAKIDLSATVGMKDETSSTASTYLSKYYCYCGNSLTAHRECNDTGLCGKNHALPNSGEENSDGIPKGIKDDNSRIWNSIAINNRVDDKKDVARAVYERTVRETKRSYLWDYETQIGVSGERINYTAIPPETYESVLASGVFPMTKISYAPVTSQDFSFLGSGYFNSGGEYLNPSYFENYKGVVSKYRSLNLAYKTPKTVDHIIELQERFLGKVDHTYLPDTWWQMMADMLAGRPDWYQRPGMPLPWDEYNISETVRGTLYETVIRPSTYYSFNYKQNENRMAVRTMKAPANYQQLFRMNEYDAVYYFADNSYKFAIADESGSFTDSFTVENGVDFKSASVVQHNGVLYFAGSLENGQGGIGDLTSATSTYTYSPVFAKLDCGDNGKTVVELTQLPQIDRYIKIVSFDDTIYYFTENSSGEMTAYRYSADDNGGSWEEKFTTQFDGAFSLQNIAVKSDVLYFTVLGDGNVTKVMRYSGGDETTLSEYAVINTPYDAAIRLYPTEVGIKAVHLNHMVDNRLVSFDIIDGSVTETTIETDVLYEVSEVKTTYCIVDEQSQAIPGVSINGNCEPLVNYNHQTVSYFDYKFTLAGKENRLFIGRLTGIRTTLINEDDSLTNEHFKWIGHSVRNIQISGNRLFAASSDKVRIYGISDGQLTRIGSINADNPRNIRISNNKLFVADGRQISIWNISGETPLFEREIETSYKVKDIEIVNGKLFVYEEETYWYWFWLRKRTKFEIIDLGAEVGDETVVYTNGVSCKDSEMMQDDNFVYLGCQDSNYKINLEAPFVGEAINGEKRYFRDSYSYESRVYQTFSGAVHISE